MASDDSWPDPKGAGGATPSPPAWVIPARPVFPETQGDVTATARRLPVRPSPVFGGLVAAFVASGVLAAKEVGDPRIWVFTFVALGWVISLCLHEFAHAAVAWKGGDRSGEARGYLTLHPLRYMNSQMSIVLPVLIVLIGGIALPGGAVMIDRHAVPDRRMRSLISAAGPLTNLACAFACGLPLATGLVHFDLLTISSRSGSFPAALAFLTLLEVVATVLNALPVPGFDGFGVVAPYLPEDTVAALMPISRFAWFGLFIILFYSASANRAFFDACGRVLSAIGVDGNLAVIGQILFTFWKRLPGGLGGL